MTKPPKVRCPYCQKLAEWVENKVIYGKRYGKSYMIYWCRECDAYVGCHNNSKRPLGTMADKALRAKRKKVHSVIDPLWKRGRYRRGEVYAILAKAFGEPVHVGESDMDRCDEIIEVARELFRTS